MEIKPRYFLRIIDVFFLLSSLFIDPNHRLTVTLVNHQRNNLLTSCWPTNRLNWWNKSPIIIIDHDLVSITIIFINFFFISVEQIQILEVFRNRQSEEHQRYNAMLSHQRGHALLIRKKWRQLKQFLIGPRGSWANRCVSLPSIQLDCWLLLLLFDCIRVEVEQRWKLSHCENRLRMRLKMVPNPHFDPHIQASRLRDNTGTSKNNKS